MFSLLLSFLISLSSHSWLFFWLGLEINLLSFIPIIMVIPFMMNFEITIKYFIPQVFGSLFMIFYFMSHEKNSLDMSMNFLFDLSLIIKLGLFPSHLWYLNIMKYVNYLPMIILMTFQKLIPMFATMMYFSLLMLMTILFSSLFIMLINLTSSSVRKMLALSSIMNISWMIIMLKINIMTWFMFFLLYSLISFYIITLMKKFNLINLAKSFSMPILSFINLLFMMLWLMGLPPMPNFLMKIHIIMMLLSENNIIMLIFFLLSSILMNMMYFRLSLPLLTLSKTFTTSKMNLKSKETLTPYFVNLFLMLSLLK